MSDGPESPFVHLCQPDGSKSCAACCGIYNYVASARPELLLRLRERTRLFREIVRGPDDLARFSERVKGPEDGRRRYDVIHCCEYVGFLDPAEKRVGCLLHPMQNGGRDMRDVSFYGRELCDGHFCPSYSYLSRAEKLALLAVLDDWYLYGACVTDIDFVKEFFRLLSEAAGEMPKPDAFEEPRLRAAVRAFFELKETWPWRSPSAGRLGKYSFDGTEYSIVSIDYAALGSPPSPLDRLFQSLQSEFSAAADVRAAEHLLRRHVEKAAALYLGRVED